MVLCGLCCKKKNEQASEQPETIQMPAPLLHRSYSAGENIYAEIGPENLEAANFNFVYWFRQQSDTKLQEARQRFIKLRDQDIKLRMASKASIDSGLCSETSEILNAPVKLRLKSEGKSQYQEIELNPYATTDEISDTISPYGVTTASQPAGVDIISPYSLTTNMGHRHLSLAGNHIGSKALKSGVKSQYQEIELNTYATADEISDTISPYGDGVTTAGQSVDMISPYSVTTNMGPRHSKTIGSSKTTPAFGVFYEDHVYSKPLKDVQRRTATLPTRTEHSQRDTDSIYGVAPDLPPRSSDLLTGIPDVVAGSRISSALLKESSFREVANSSFDSRGIRSSSRNVQSNRNRKTDESFDPLLYENWVKESSVREVDNSSFDGRGIHNSSKKSHRNQNKNTDEAFETLLYENVLQESSVRDAPHQSTDKSKLNNRSRKVRTSKKADKSPEILYENI